MHGSWDETAEAALEMYRRMRRIRSFEERASDLYRDGEIPGFLHLSIGQEAAAVGACWPLGVNDVITSTHRGHGHCIAKGMDVTGMFAELMGKRTGICRGRGGSMHIADPGLGIFGANGIVGAGLPIAVGAATATVLQRSGGIVVAFFGDGAIAQGMFHEAVNLAATWSLPVVFCCENNHYAEFSPSRETRLAERAAGYGVEFYRVNGNDVGAMADLFGAVVRDLRATPRPVLVEADTYRWQGHYEGDPMRYRTEEELAEAKTRDPLAQARGRLHAYGMSEEGLDAADADIQQEIDTAVEAAREAEEPSIDTLHHYVITPRETVVEPPDPPSGVDDPVFRTMDAVHDALEFELSSDPSVFLAGVDVGRSGNVFGLTRGLTDEFTGRVADAPISEMAIVGMAVGAAMAGIRAVVELMYIDFLGVCLDQLLNQAAKMRFMTGGRAQLPLVVRTQFGAGRSSGAQHSQSLEAMLAHIPGLTVVMPSTPADTYGLLRAAIRDPNPVVFIENRLLYGRKGPRPHPQHLVPIGKAKVVREGTDVTLVSYSRMLHRCLEAADELADERVSVEVIDLRTIAPLDTATVLTSLAKTNRLVIAHEAVGDFGVGAELAAVAASEGFWSLDAPIERVAAAATPAPYSPALERAWLPDRDAVVAAVRRTLAE